MTYAAGKIVRSYDHQVGQYFRLKYMQNTDGAWHRYLAADYFAIQIHSDIMFTDFCSS